MGRTRRYRVRIRTPVGPFVGMDEFREEEWELTDEQAARFVHVDGYAYATPVLSEGERELCLIPKHEEMVREHSAGKLLIGIPRPEARRFFTQLSLGKIAGLIGEHPFIEWLTVRSSWVLLHLAIPVSVVLAVLAFRWFAFLVVPIAICFMGFWLAASSTGFRRLRWPLLLLVAAAVKLSFFSSTGGLYFSLWFAVSAAAVFLITFTYNGAGFFLRLLVLRNERAYRVCAERGLCLVRRAE